MDHIWTSVANDRFCKNWKPVLPKMLDTYCSIVGEW